MRTCLLAGTRGGLFPYDAVIADVGLRGGERLARGAAANLAYPVSRVAPTSTRSVRMVVDVGVGARRGGGCELAAG